MAGSRSEPGSSPAASSSLDRGVPSGPGSPLVSVLIPVHNGRALVPGAFGSVKAQQYPRLEIRLIDDGSTDGTSAILRKFALADPRVLVASNERNIGLAGTLNRGLREARGPLVLVLHQDCLLLGNDWVSRAVASFDDPSVMSVVGSPRHDINAMPLREREFWVIRSHAAPASLNTSISSRRQLFSENKCDLFRREPLLEMGGFDERLREGGEDQVIAWRFARSHWRVVFREDLPYRITLGDGPHLRPHLRREMSYGRQMRQVLAITHGGAIRRAPGAPADERLVNRAAGVGWIVASIILGVLAAAFRSDWLAFLVLAPPALRWLQLAIRATRLRSIYRFSAGNILGVGGVGLLADLAYGVGLIAPTRRPPTQPPTAPQGGPP